MQTYISREQDYALRITALLAGLPGGKFLPVSKIASVLNISKSFASRIVHKLKKADYINAYQGKYGGVYLAKPAGLISVYDILNCIGFKMKFNQCLCDGFNCTIMPLCKFHSVFAAQETRLHDTFSKMTLADFAIQIDN